MLLFIKGVYLYFGIRSHFFWKNWNWVGFFHSLVLQCCAPQSISFKVWQRTMQAPRWDPRWGWRWSAAGTAAQTLILCCTLLCLSPEGRGWHLQCPRQAEWGSQSRVLVSQRSPWLIPHEASGSGPLQEKEQRWSKASHILLHPVSRDSWGLWHLRRDWVPKCLLARAFLVRRAEGRQICYFSNSFGIIERRSLQCYQDCVWRANLRSLGGIIDGNWVVVFNTCRWLVVLPIWSHSLCTVSISFSEQQ